MSGHVFKKHVLKYDMSYWKVLPHEVRFYRMAYAGGYVLLEGMW